MAFDPQAVTRAYIDGLGPAALAKAEAYTTGSHWLMLGGLIVTAIVTAVFVRRASWTGWIYALPNAAARCAISSCSRCISSCPRS